MFRAHTRRGIGGRLHILLSFSRSSKYRVRGVGERGRLQSSALLRVTFGLLGSRVGYLARAVANLRPRAAPSDKRPTRPISGKGLPVWGHSSLSWASAVGTGSAAANTS